MHGAFICLYTVLLRCTLSVLTVGSPCMSITHLINFAFKPIILPNTQHQQRPRARTCSYTPYRILSAYTYLPAVPEGQHWGYLSHYERPAWPDKKKTQKITACTRYAKNVKLVPVWSIYYNCMPLSSVQICVWVVGCLVDKRWYMLRKHL